MMCKHCQKEITDEFKPSMILELNSQKVEYSHGCCYNEWWDKCYLENNPDAQRKKYREEWLKLRMSQGHFN